MNHFLQKPSVIKSLLLLALTLNVTLNTALAGAEDGKSDVKAGAVLHVSGPLLVTRAGAANRILAPNSAVRPGDTLITQNRGYAQIRFSDGSLLILQPGTTLTVEKFSYDAGKPEADQALFTLQQGGIRSTAGLLGKRSKDRVVVNTPAATLTLDNASVVIQYQAPDATAQAQAAEAAQIAQRAFLFASTAALDGALMTTRSDAPPPAPSASLLLAQLPPNIPLPNKGPGLAPGLYVHVIDGLINVANQAGTTNFSPGQFGFTPNFSQPPALLPTNPGVQFQVPPSFVPSAPSGASGPAKPKTIDCEVR